MVANTAIAALGDELLANALDLLSPSQLATAEACCKRWRRVCHEHGLWRRHTTLALAELQDRRVLHLPDLDGLGLSWKQRYLEYAFLLAGTIGYHPPAHRQGTKSFARVLTAHQGAVTSCATLGTRLVTGSEDKTARIWDLDMLQTASGALLQPLHTLHHASPVLYASLLSPGTALTATAACGYVWRGGQLVRRLGDGGSQGGPAIKCATAWDTYLAAGMSDGSIRVYDVYGGSLVKLLRPHGAEVTSLLHVSHCGSDLLVSAGCETVAVTAVESGLQLAQALLPPMYRGGSPPVSRLSSVIISPGTGHLVAIADGTALVSWDCGANLSLLPSPLQRVGMEGPTLLRPLGCRSVASLARLAVPTFGSTSCLLAATSRGGLEAYRLQLLATDLPRTLPALPLRGLQMSPFPLASLDSSNSAGMAEEEVGASVSIVGWSRVLAGQDSGGFHADWILQPSMRQQGLRPVDDRNGEGGCKVWESVSDAAAVKKPAAKSEMPSSSARAAASVVAGRAGGPLRSSLDSCLCLCAAQVPFVTGHRNGQVVLWWRKRS